jgi:hypothetical protein
VLESAFAPPLEASFQVNSFRAKPMMIAGDDVLLAIDLFGLVLIVIVLGPQIYRDRRRASTRAADRQQTAAVKPISMPEERL